MPSRDKIEIEVGTLRDVFAWLDRLQTFDRAVRLREPGDQWQPLTWPQQTALNRAVIALEAALMDYEEGV